MINVRITRVSKGMQKGSPAMMRPVENIFEPTAARWAVGRSATPGRDGTADSRARGEGGGDVGAEGGGEIIADRRERTRDGEVEGE